jgi:alpha-glucoside transport system substrate-binding protein
VRIIHNRRSMRLTVAAAALALAAAACGGDDSSGDDAGTGDQNLKGTTLEVAAVWTGAEQDNFKKVLNAFSEKTGATVTLTPTGDNVSTYLGSKIQGGQPPDVAFLPQQGVLVQFAKQGALKPIGPDAEKALDENFSKIWKDFATVDGKVHGVYFKAANKSTVWYRAKAFEDAGVEPPATWDEFVQAAQTVSDSGVPPLAMAGGDGWTLTDWFENVYLSQAGPENYDKLSKHEIKWTDPTVVKALETLGQLWSKPALLVGGAKGSLQTDFPTSVANVFGDNPKGAIPGVVADFVAGVVASSTKAKVGEDAKIFPFPKVGDEAPVVSGGDVAVAMKDNAGAKALLAYLATPDAAKVWAEGGGFLSPNKNLDSEAYPDDTFKAMGKALIDAGDNVRFDMSDLAPASFGGTKGVGEWKRLQDFLAAPTNATAAAAALEADAAKAFK